MKRKTAAAIIVFLCLAILFSGCRARVIGDKNAADETTVDPKITSLKYRPKEVSTVQQTETTTQENTQAVILKKVNSSSGHTVYAAGNGTGNASVSSRRYNSRRSSTRAQRTTSRPKAKTTTKRTTTTKKAVQPNAPKFTVSFNVNGGWGKAKSRKVTLGSTYGEDFPKVYNTKGYTFLGWYDAKNGGKLVKNTDIFSYNKDITLYAHWDYNPSVYWRNYLVSANLYPCQIQKIYVEFDEDNKTTKSSTVVTLTRSENAAENSSTLSPTDAQIKALGCDMIIKVVSDYENAETYYNKMKSRFSYKPVYILPKAAEYGTNDEKTYYSLLLSEKIYEKGFPDFDKAKCQKELGISGSIYTKD